MRLSGRQKVAVGGFVVTLLAAGLVVGRERDTDRSAALPGTPHVRAAAQVQEPDTERTRAVDLELALLSRPLAQQIEEHLFSVPVPPPLPAATAPRPAPSAAPPPAQPAAPPLPFRFLGRMVDRGVTTVFVAHGRESLGMKEGDEVDRLYKVERVTDSHLVLIHLPSQEKQALTFGGRP